MTKYGNTKRTSLDVCLKKRDVRPHKWKSSLPLDTKSKTCRFCEHYSKPKPSALDIAIMSFSRRTSALSYCGSTSWLKHVWASGRLSGLFVILVILNVISPIPPTGTLSLPVVNNRNFFFSSGDRAWRISQKSLEHENSIYYKCLNHYAAVWKCIALEECSYFLLKGVGELIDRIWELTDTYIV